MAKKAKKKPAQAETYEQVRLAEIETSQGTLLRAVLAEFRTSDNEFVRCDLLSPHFVDVPDAARFTEALDAALMMPVLQLANVRRVH